MAKTQTKLKQTAAEAGKRTNPFELVREGAPLPAIASQKVAIRTPKPSRSPRPNVALQPDSCPLCGGVVARFDAEVFASFGRCAPCHEALTEP